MYSAIVTCAGHKWDKNNLEIRPINSEKMIEQLKKEAREENKMVYVHPNITISGGMISQEDFQNIIKELF